MDSPGFLYDVSQGDFSTLEVNKANSSGIKDSLRQSASKSMLLQYHSKGVSFSKEERKLDIKFIRKNLMKRDEQQPKVNVPVSYLSNDIPVSMKSRV